jgi:hypothetical protein
MPKDSLLVPRSRARVDVAQTHRLPECLPEPRQPLEDTLDVVVGVVVVLRGGHGDCISGSGIADAPGSA